MVQKMHAFFFHELQLISLLLIRNSYLKMCEIFHSRFRLAFIKLYIFVQQSGLEKMAKTLILNPICSPQFFSMSFTPTSSYAI